MGKQQTGAKAKTKSEMDPTTTPDGAKTEGDGDSTPGPGGGSTKRPNLPSNAPKANGN